MGKRRSSSVDIFEDDEVNDVLRDTFYATKRKRRRTKAKPQKADHYDVICISLYNEDLERLDKMVQTLKKKGHRKMSRSALIRFALDQVDLDALPRGY